MTRGISIDGVSLPVIDANISYSRDIVSHPSMLTIGGEYIYNGLYSNIQGSFGGAYRPTIFAPYIADMLEDNPATRAIIVSDIDTNTWVTTDARLTSAEISISAGELAKINCAFVSRDIAQTTAFMEVPDYSETIPIFSDSYMITMWGDDLQPICGMTFKSFSIKVERPYTADEFTFDNITTSTTIYQSGDIKISGTFTLGQTSKILASFRLMDIRLGSNTIIVNYPFVTAIENNISGRSLVNKSFTWSCKKSMFAFTYE